MKTLITTIPHIPGYFNAAYNMSIFQVGAYLRAKRPQDIIVCKDMAALNFTWKDIANLLRSERFDLVALLGDYDSIDSLERMLFYVKELIPDSKTMIFGRLPMQIPLFFQQFSLDYIAYRGDYEINVESVINTLETGEVPLGCFYKQVDRYSKGIIPPILKPEDFTFPDVSEVPYSAYYNLYKNDDSRYCGIPDRKELVVHVSRGCPIGCEFCDVQMLQGKRDRRVSAERVVSYIEQNKSSFEYVSFFSAIFTLNKAWLREFCRLMIERHISMSWKCVTTVASLKTCDLELMHAAGCFRVGLGIETLEAETSTLLPLHKRIKHQEVDALLRHCQSVGIEVNAFLMCGLEGETRQGIEYSIKHVEKLGARARLSLYTPYQTLSDTMSKAQVCQLNRQTFTDDSDFDFYHKQYVYDFLYKWKYAESVVQSRVPKK